MLPNKSGAVRPIEPEFKLYNFILRLKNTPINTHGRNLALVFICISFLSVIFTSCAGTTTTGRRVERPSAKAPEKAGPKPKVKKPDETIVASIPKSKYPLSGKSYVINGQRYHILGSAQSYSETGMASWYGKKFHGRKTASGARYNMYAMTAAHKTLPLGTWVKVYSHSTDKEITVLVNDRGPFIRGRIIDLSYTAANKLGVVGPGTARVTVQALGHVEKREIQGKVKEVLVQPDDWNKGRFSVQVGAFKEKSNALAVAKKLKPVYGSIRIEPYDNGTDLFYRVIVSERPTIGQATALRQRLENQGFAGSFIVAR